MLAVGPLGPQYSLIFAWHELGKHAHMPQLVDIFAEHHLLPLPPSLRICFLSPADRGPSPQWIHSQRQKPEAGWHPRRIPGEVPLPHREAEQEPIGKLELY